MNVNIAALLYLVAGVLFIFALRGLSSPETSRAGNRYGVMVEVRLPKHHDLAVKKQKQILDMQTQLPAVINEAFGALEKQLKKTVDPF